MARKSRPTFKKRQKEIARQQKARDKLNRRLEKKEGEEGELPPVIAGQEDPDIAGIQPGPQPLPEEWSYVPGHLPQATTSAATEKEAASDKPPEQKSDGDAQ